MVISYNLNFRKLHPAGQCLLEKEGEIVLHEKGFRLKGKGAYDQGELVHFSDVKEIEIREDSMEFVNFFNYRFFLSHFGNLFEQFLHDLYRVRNEFLIEALFLRQGKIVCEFEVYFERFSPEGISEIKGPAKIRLYDESLVIIPKESDVFSLPFLFFKFHEFDEDAYRLKITLEDGSVVIISQLGNQFEEFQERFEEALATMYNTIFKQFQFFFFNVDSNLLIKLANAMKRGKAVSLKDLQKIDKDLAKTIEDSVFKDEAFLKTVEPLQRHVDPQHLFIGLHMLDGKKEIYWFSVIFAVPSEDMLTCTIGSYEKDLRKVQDTYFFKLDRESGDIEQEIIRKVFELNQALTLLHFVPDPFYKDKRELRKSLYKLAIRKLPFLRNLRRHFLGRCPSILPEIFQRNFAKFREAATAATPHL